MTSPTRPTGRTLTQTFITEGADVIFPVAGNVGLGAAKAVQNADASAGSQKVNMEWVDTDGCISAAQYCKYFITSVTKGIQTAVKNAVTTAANGSFKGGNYIGTLAERRGDAGAVPRLRQQDPVQPEVRAEHDQGRASSTARSRCHEEPGVTAGRSGLIVEFPGPGRYRVPGRELMCSVSDQAPEGMRQAGEP